MNINLAKELNECYVEYVNDFLTVERYASYKGWSLFFAKQVINSGRKINHNQALLKQIHQNDYFNDLYNEDVLYNQLSHSIYDHLYIEYYKG